MEIFDGVNHITMFSYLRTTINLNGEAFEVEFMTLDGNSLTVETLAAKQIRAARNRDIPHVRERTFAAQ